MYDYIFAFWFQLFEKLKSNDSPFQATMFTGVAIFFHFALIIAVVKRLGFHYTFLHQTQVTKYYYLPLVFLSIYIIERIYKQRRSRVIEKYGSRNLCTWYNAVIVGSLTILPLAIAIKMLTN